MRKFMYELTNTKTADSFRCNTLLYKSSNESISGLGPAFILVDKPNAIIHNLNKNDELQLAFKFFQAGPVNYRLFYQATNDYKHFNYLASSNVNEISKIKGFSFNLEEIPENHPVNPTEKILKCKWTDISSNLTGIYTLSYFDERNFIKNNLNLIQGMIGYSKFQIKARNSKPRPPKILMYSSLLSDYEETHRNKTLYLVNREKGEIICRVFHDLNINLDIKIIKNKKVLENLLPIKRRNYYSEVKSNYGYLKIINHFYSF